jgi:DNA-binding FadR family transcriptional regulator
VLERLRRAVLDGQYAAGDYLPPERQLATALGVSRLTLRAALAKLEAEGLVRARQGDGVLVLDVMQHAGLGVLAHLDIAERTDVLRSFLELRRAVAVEAVAQACERATPADLAELKQLAALQASESDLRRYVERDVQFARVVLRASQSFATLLLFNTLEPISAAHPAFSEALVEDRERSLAGYTATVSLIEAKDPEVARMVLRKGLEAADDEVLKAIARKRRHTKRSQR